MRDLVRLAALAVLAVIGLVLLGHVVKVLAWIGLVIALVVVGNAAYRTWRATSDTARR